MSSDPTEDTRIRMQELPTVGCQVVLSLGAASRMDIAERLEAILPPVWRIDSDFHRTTDNGVDLFFHTIETQNDRVKVDVLERFGDNFAEVKQQQSVEMARDESPELFEQAVDSLGRERAIEMFSDMGVSDDSGLRIFARPREQVPAEVDVDVFLRAVTGSLTSEEQMENIIKREFMGELYRVERAGDRSFLIGGEPVGTVGRLRQTVDAIDDAEVIDRRQSTVVCRVSERRPG